MEKLQTDRKKNVGVQRERVERANEESSFHFFLSFSFSLSLSSVLSSSLHDVRRGQRMREEEGRHTLVQLVGHRTRRKWIREEEEKKKKKDYFFFLSLSFLLSSPYVHVHDISVAVNEGKEMNLTWLCKGGAERIGKKRETEERRREKKKKKMMMMMINIELSTSSLFLFLCPLDSDLSLCRRIEEEGGREEGG